MALRRFGFAKGLRKPRTESDWDHIWRQNKYEVPSVKKISLTLSDKGSGQTGARRFKTFMIPPLQHWNPKLVVDIKRDLEKPVAPTLSVEFNSGETQTIELKGVHVDKIKLDFLKLDAAKRGVQLNLPNKNEQSTL